MGIHLRRFCVGLLLAALCGTASSQNTCGPINLDADYDRDPNATIGTFSIEDNNPGECTDPLLIVGTFKGLSLSAKEYNPCTGDWKWIYPLGSPNQDTTLRTVLKGICGTPWVAFNIPPSNGNPKSRTAGVTASPSTSGAAQPVSGQSSQSVLLVDVDGDGNLDTVGLGVRGATVMLQSANGLPLSTNTFPVGFTPSAVNSKMVAGDFNSDGKLDLAISYFGNADTGLGGAVFILLGNGDGTFGAPQQVNAGPNPGSLAAADFNGDGKLDLAVANDDTPNVSILAGKGDGTFGSPAVYITAQNETGIGSPRALVAADFNGDGLPDLAVDFTDRVFVLLNNHGAFGQAIATRVPYSPTYLAYSDLNHDGHMDLALIGLNSLIFLFGNGDGTFQVPASYATGNQPGSLTLMPTEDNYTLAIVPDEFTGNVWFTIIAPDGSTNASLLLSVPGQPTGIAVADLTGDGKPDIVVTGIPTDLSVLLQGSSQFLPPAPYTLAPGGSAQPQAPAIGDFNGDGKPDVITANYNGTVSLLLGNGDGTLKPPSSSTINAGARGIALGDFNGDGKLDAAVAAEGTPPSSGSDNGGVVVLLGNGNGTFEANTLNVATGRPISVAAGDFNGDGKLDLATVTIGPNGSVQRVTLAVFLGKGDGTFASALSTTLKVSASGTAVVAAGDLNGDGKLDLAVSSDSNGVDILLGNGDGTFREIVQPHAESALFDIALADVNQDGILDLAVIGVDGAYLIGNGDGTFQPEQHFPSGISPVALAVYNPKSPTFFFADQNGAVTPLKQVAQPAAPVINANVSGANLTLATVAPSSIGTIFGYNFASAPAEFNGAPPLSLGGVSVNVVDSNGTSIAAPLFYVSPNQINYEVPDGTATGAATITVTSSVGLTGSGTTMVASVAPGIFELTPAGLIAAIVLDISASGGQSFANVYQVNASNNIEPLPVDLSASQVYLEIYCTGIRNASASSVAVTIGGVNVPVYSAGSQGTDPGLDQINAGPLPKSLMGSGQVNVIVTANGQAANTTNITFK